MSNISREFELAAKIAKLEEINADHHELNGNLRAELSKLKRHISGLESTNRNLSHKVDELRVMFHKADDVITAMRSAGATLEAYVVGKS